MPPEIASAPVRAQANGHHTADAFPMTIQPMDGANREFLRNVCPPAWYNSTPSGRYSSLVPLAAIGDATTDNQYDAVGVQGGM